MIEPATELAAYAPEIIEVDNVLSDTQFVAKRGAAGSTAGTIAASAFLTLIGSSYAEGTGAPRAVSRNPIKFLNYTQIFKNTYELSGTADKTKARTGDAWSNDKKRKAYDHSRDIEMAFLFGRRSETTGDNGKPKRTMGGLRTFIPAANSMIFGANVTSDQFVNALAPVFDFNTGAGDTRVAFLGSSAALELGKIMNANTNVRINSTERVKVYGIHFQELLLPQGRILFKTHPLLSRHSVYTKSCFVLDFDAIKWAPMDGRDTKAKDDVQTEDEDVRRGFFMTEGGLEVGLYGFALDPSTQKIRPQELAERRRVLGVPAGAPQFARQRAERIVNKPGHGLRQILVRTQAALVVVRMHPAVIVQDEPERIGLQRPEVFHHGNQYFFDAFVMQRQRHVVMIDDVVAVLGAKHDRDHMLA
jgi:hypothetical protein